MKRLFAILLSVGLALLSAYGQEFGIPRPPAELRSPELRAGWLLCHYWDNADFTNLEGRELEQAFVNYLQLFPIADSDSLSREGVRILMERAESRNSTGKVYSVAEKYLYNLNSPMADEEKFVYFVPWAPNPAYIERVLASNRVGSQICEFGFVCENGVRKEFGSIDGTRLLLLFEIGCRDCRDAIEALKNGAAGDVKVVAVAVNSQWEDFLELAGTLPENWVKGFDSAGTINGTSFAIRKLPDMYLVDSDGTVLKKHIKL